MIVFLLASCLSTIMKTDSWCHPRISNKHLHEKVHATQKKKQPPISNFLSSSRPNTDSQKPTTCHRCDIYHPSQDDLDSTDRKTTAECQNTDGCVFIPFNTGKWLFVGCIIFSFLLASLFPNNHHRSLLIVVHSWHTSPEKPRKLSLVETSLTHSPISWPTITTPFVRLSYCQNSQLLLISLTRLLRSLLFLWPYQQFH